MSIQRASAAILIFGFCLFAAFGFVLTLAVVLGMDTTDAQSTQWVALLTTAVGLGLVAGYATTRFTFRASRYLAPKIMNRPTT